MLPVVFAERDPGAVAADVALYQATKINLKSELSMIYDK